MTKNNKKNYEIFLILSFSLRSFFCWNLNISAVKWPITSKIVTGYVKCPKYLPKTFWCHWNKNWRKKSTTWTHHIKALDPYKGDMHLSGVFTCHVEHAPGFRKSRKNTCLRQRLLSSITGVTNFLFACSRLEVENKFGVEFFRFAKLR